MKTSRIKVANLLMAGFGQAREDAAHAYTRNRATMLGLGLAALLLSGAAAALIIMRLRRALGGEPDQAAHTAARIAEGDLSAAIALRPGDQVSMLYEMERMRASLGMLVAQVRADAARQVGTLIKASVAQADAGGEQVRAADVAMQEIVAGVARVADLLGQIRHASAEQHQGIAACSDAVVQMDQGTQQNACLLYTSPSPRDRTRSRMPSSA